jgi:hypothetical protein
MKYKLLLGILIFFIVAFSCRASKGLKTSNKLLDEFRVDEYREYVVISIDKEDKNFSNIAMYNYEKKRYVFVKIPNWLAEYWSEGDTIR